MHRIAGMLGLAILPMLLNLGLAQAQSASAPTASAHPPSPRVTEPADEAGCKALDGIWSTGRIPGAPGAVPYCHLPAADAGKPCSDSSQCQTQHCEPARGRKAEQPGVCAQYAGFDGCRADVRNGTVQPVICAH